MLLIRMGDSYRIENDYEKAEEYYKEVIKFDPKNRYAIYGLRKISELRDDNSNK